MPESGGSYEDECDKGLKKKEREVKEQEISER